MHFPKKFKPFSLTALLGTQSAKNSQHNVVIKKKSRLATGLFYSTKLILQLAGQGVADRAHGVVDLLAERGHHCNHDDGDERENDRVLNQTLTFFLGSE